MQKLRVALWALIGIGTLAGLYGASLRFVAEASNKRIELTLDMTELQKLASAEGVPTARVLERFRQAGITSVAITEDTLASLEESRRVEAIPSAEPGVTYLMTHQGSYSRILAAIQSRTHFKLDPNNEYAQIRVPPGAELLKVEDLGMEVYQPFSVIKTIGVGLDPNLLQMVKNANMSVVGRLQNSVNIPNTGIGWALEQLKSQGVKTVIFSGDDVLGYDSQLRTTAEALGAKHLQVGIVEFTKIKGDTLLHQLATEQVVRVHTIPGAEMATATPADNIQRFSLAARERNIRMLYIRLFLEKTNPLNENIEYIETLVKSLKRGGLTIGEAHTYPLFAVPLAARVLIGLGLAATLFLLCQELFGLLGDLAHPLSLLVLAGAGGLVVLAAVSPKLAALAAAVVFAGFAVVQGGLLSPVEWGKKPLRVALLRLVRIVGVTTLGIISVVGLLATQAFIVKADAFVGIKAALYLPLLLAVLVWAVGLRTESPAALLSLLRRQLQRALLLINEPVRFWQVGAGLAILIILAMLWLRSGNEGAVVVTGFELRFRDLLDATLPVRPRFKALLFAALLLGIYLAGRGERRWGVPLYLLGVIAVTDYLNTFCHLHIPLLVSVMRDSLGVVLGLGLGTLLIVLLERHWKKTKS